MLPNFVMAMAAWAKLRQISNARIAGMDVDLGLDQGNRYSVALVVFFIPYLLFEVTITSPPAGFSVASS
jgi:hypothetical protein